jgi:hypothetical protein
MDPIDAARAARERAEVEAVRRHPAREPSDPPPSSSPTRASFRVGVAHFAGWAERMSKRVTVLLAIASSASVVGSFGFAFWTAHQDFVHQNQIADINASVRRIELAVESISLGTKNDREQVRLINETLFAHTQQIAAMSGPGKRVRQIGP